MSLKILMLTTSLNCGGAETHLCELSKALHADGHRITVVSQGGSLVSVLRSCGVEHRKLPLNRKNPLCLLYAKRKLSRLIKQEDFDLIHAHARLPAFLVAPPAKRRHIPLVTTVHAHFSCTPLRRRLSRWGEKVIAVSEDLKQYLTEQYGYPADRIDVIPNGIDTRYFSPPAVSPSSEQTFRLLFVSRLDRDCARAAFLLCRMAQSLKETYPKLEIQIAGGGSALPRLQRLAEAVNRRAPAPFLFLLGQVSDLRPLYRNAHAVIGVSRVALEAMACGCPVVLAGNEGMLGLTEESLLPTAASGNFCCRNTVPLSEKNLKAELCRLLSESDEKRKCSGQALSEYVRRFHSLSAMAESTEEFYESVLCRRPTRTFADGVLCGYYGYRNMGDDALLHASIRRAEAEYPDYTFSALTKNGKKDSFFFGIRCVSRRNLRALLREIKHAKLLVFGGGTLLQDGTSLRSLLYYAFVLRYAHHRGLRIELWGNGLEVPHTAIGERIITDCLNRCDKIGLRDAPSLAWALGHVDESHKERFVSEEDLAAHTPPPAHTRTEFLCHRYGLCPPPLGNAPVGFGVVAVRGKIGKGYLNILISWLAMLRGERIRLLFVPMLPSEDRRTCVRLAAMLNGKVAEHLSPSDLVGLMSRARIVCGMRLHALVFSACAETPFVGFGSDPKIEAFCREHGGVFFTDLY